MKLVKRLRRGLMGRPPKASRPGPLKLPVFTQMNAGRFLYCRRLFDLIRDVDGDVVECGVGEGATFLFWATLCTDEGRHRRLWGFDSFEGFPEPTSEDLSPRGSKRGEWAVSTPETVTAMLIESGLSREWVRSHVTLVKGFFEDSLSNYTGKEIALLHIDADLYQSYKTTLSMLYDKVVGGGIIMFDEYMGTFEHINFPGAKQAIDEFLSDRDADIGGDVPFGKYYLIKRD